MNLLLNFSCNNFTFLLFASSLTFILSLFIYPFYINWLKSKQLGQFIREEGPQSHAVKAKTPTMGGLVIIFLSTIVPMAFYLIKAKDAINLKEGSFFELFIVLFFAASCGILGLADDYGKITSHSNAGLSARFRLLIEFILGIGLSLICYFSDFLPKSLSLFSLFSNSQLLTHSVFVLHGPLSLVYLFVFVPFLFMATSNSLNLHDGMDGLAAGTSAIVFASLTFMFMTSNYFVLALISAIACGAMLGFLVFNRYRAKIFMGDTGSLYIGALMSVLVIAGGLSLFFIPLALIYILESLSVILQVSYFKLTKEYKSESHKNIFSLALYKLTHRLPGEGKRLFRMAPLHHHFEALAADSGIKEWQVVICFWLVQAFISLIVLSIFIRGTLQ